MSIYYNDSIFKIFKKTLVIEFDLETKVSSMQFSECYFPVLVHLKNHHSTNKDTHTQHKKTQKKHTPPTSLAPPCFPHTHTTHFTHLTPHTILHTTPTNDSQTHGIYLASERL